MDEGGVDARLAAAVGGEQLARVLKLPARVRAHQELEGEPRAVGAQRVARPAAAAEARVAHARHPLVKVAHAPPLPVAPLSPGAKEGASELCARRCVLVDLLAVHRGPAFGAVRPGLLWPDFCVARRAPDSVPLLLCVLRQLREGLVLGSGKSKAMDYYPAEKKDPDRQNGELFKKNAYGSGNSC